MQRGGGTVALPPIHPISPPSAFVASVTAQVRSGRAFPPSNASVNSMRLCCVHSAQVVGGYEC